VPQACNDSYTIRFARRRDRPWSARCIIAREMMHVLVAYASNVDGEATLAEAVARGMIAARADVIADVESIDAQPALDRYDAVVLGSSMERGRWLAKATAFAVRQRAELEKKAVASYATVLPPIDRATRRLVGEAIALRRARRLLEHQLPAGVGRNLINGTVFCGDAIRRYGLIEALSERLCAAVVGNTRTIERIVPTCERWGEGIAAQLVARAFARERARLVFPASPLQRSSNDHIDAGMMALFTVEP
jgi:hypothetical protein